MEYVYIVMLDLAMPWDESSNYIIDSVYLYSDKEYVMRQYEPECYTIECYEIVK